ncbi:hypothetical protein LSTR_LSTR011631 [Laodelphax striatellus]|uniref:Major facilitator superfamily (MFS) profile domain-containing protein n=1 Tax=Laodelphax striatellus TaxID=195883 RepID=A0A482X7P6_LAOST|nr:hypothetical protein LSTR_LSTR011631 [Laodelphax striatellus]
MATSVDIDEDDASNKQNREAYQLRSNIAQIVATLGFCILLAAVGLMLSMPTIVIGGLLGIEDQLSLDENDASWLGSLIFLTQPLGSCVSGFLQDRLGRKKCMMGATIPQIIGWIILYYSTSVAQLYIASILMGVGIGFIEAPVLSYIGEVTEPRMRGPMSVLGGSFCGIGILIECFFGAIADWRNVCAMSASFPVMALIALCFIPESPVWLICVGRIAEAEQALCWLRGWVHPAYVRKEFLSLLTHLNSPCAQELVDISKDNKDMKDFRKEQKTTNLSHGFMDNLLILTRPSIYKPFTLIIIYFFVSNSISLLGMKPFLVKIFKDMGMPISAHWVLVVSSGLQVVGMVACILTMHLFGKRLITFLSLPRSLTSCILLGLLPMLQPQYPRIAFFLFGLIFYAVDLSISPVPWVLLRRGIAGGLSAAGFYVLAFVVTKSYINLVHLFDVYGTCFIYSAVGLIGFVYLYMKLPETEGKTLQEIEDFFKDESTKKKKIVATLGFCLLMATVGLIFFMPTIVIGGLLGIEDQLTLNENDASWLGNMVFLTQPLGACGSGFLQDRFGRKKCMMGATIPQIIGWIILYYSTSVAQLYIASILMGVSIGFIEAPVLSCIGEVTEPRMRGPMSVLGGSFCGIGLLIECFLGAIADWRNACAISASFPVMAFIVLCFIPESPVWLICVGRTAEAEQALCWLRGWVHPAYVRKEFLSMLKHLNLPCAQELEKMTNLPHRFMDNLLILTRPSIYKPFTLIIIYFFVSNSISLLGMKPFLVKIFIDVGMPISEHWVLVVSSGLHWVGNVACILTMHLFGKRLITFLSLSVSVVSCILLGLLLMLQLQYPWIAFFLFGLIFFAAGFGVCTVPWVLLSEIYPVEGRGIAGGLSAAGFYVLAFVITKSYINLVHLFDVYGTCFIYSAVGLIGFVYLYMKLPETEGKTLQEIEDFFKDESTKQKKVGSTEKL